MSVNRRLAAILSADVVGYSRLMGADEAGTLERHQALRAETVAPVIAAHGGRNVKLMGDGTLVEFASVVGAHQPRIAGDVGRQDRGEPALDAHSGNPALRSAAARPSRRDGFL